MKLKEIKTTNGKMPGIYGICDLKINEKSKYQMCRLSGSLNCCFTFKLYEIHTYISITCQISFTDQFKHARHRHEINLQ